jgi:DNA polymerase-3 subunit delta
VGMLYILNGTDTYSSHQELQNIKSNLGDAEMLAVSTTILKGTDVNPAELRDICQVVPFMNPYRLIIVEGLLSLFETEFKTKNNNNPSNKRGNKKLDDWGIFIDAIQFIPESTVLIFIDAKIGRNNSLLKKLSPHSTVKVFPPLKDRELYSWINNRIKNSGGTINTAAMRLLVEYSSNDLWTLSNEIEKLLAYCSEKQIKEEDVMQLTCYSREANIFNLVDSIFDRKIKQTHNILQRLMKEGTNASYIIAMIARQLRLIIRVKYLEDKYNKKNAMESLNLNSEYVLSKTINQADKYTTTQLSECYHRLLQADIDIKTGKYNEDVAIDLLIADLCRY